LVKRIEVKQGQFPKSKVPRSFLSRYKGKKILKFFPRIEGNASDSPRSFRSLIHQSGGSHLKLSGSLSPYTFFNSVRLGYLNLFNPFFYLRYPLLTRSFLPFFRRYRRLFLYSTSTTLSSRRVGAALLRRGTMLCNFFRSEDESGDFSQLVGKKNVWISPNVLDDYRFRVRHGLHSRPSRANIHFNRKSKRFRSGQKKRPRFFHRLPFRYFTAKKLEHRKWHRPRWYRLGLHLWSQVPEYPLWWGLKTRGYNRKKKVSPPSINPVHGRIVIQRTWSNFFFTLVAPSGRVLGSCSAGSTGFKGKQRRTPLAVAQAAKQIAAVALRQGTRLLGLTFYRLGPRLHLASAVRALSRISGLKFSYLQEERFHPHSLGKRPKRSRRVLQKKKDFSL
jgi:ribosomal protein S11